MILATDTSNPFHDARSVTITAIDSSTTERNNRLPEPTNDPKKYQGSFTNCSASFHPRVF